MALIDAIERIERSGRPGAARDFRKHLRTFINRQLSLGVIAIDPLAGYRMPAATKDDVIEAEEHGQVIERARDPAVWRAASSIGGPFGGLVKMGLLTGLRRGELAALRWDWIDREGLKITVPGKVMKNGREHAVPITGLIAKLLDETPDRGGGLVFPSEKRLGGATPMSGWSKMMTRLRLASGVKGVGLHDLRRTFRSALADLGVREELAEAMIAHRRSDLVSRYNRAAAVDSAAGRGGKTRRLARERRFAHRWRRGQQCRAPRASEEGMTNEDERRARARQRGRDYINSEAGAVTAEALGALLEAREGEQEANSDEARAAAQAAYLSAQAAFGRATGATDVRRRRMAVEALDLPSGARVEAGEFERIFKDCLDTIETMASRNKLRRLLSRGFIDDEATFTDCRAASGRQAVRKSEGLMGASTASRRRAASTQGRGSTTTFGPTSSWRRDIPPGSSLDRTGTSRLRTGDGPSAGTAARRMAGARRREDRAREGGDDQGLVRPGRRPARRELQEGAR